MNTPNIISNLLQFSFGWIGIAATIIITVLATGFLCYYYFIEKILPKMMEEWIKENSQLRKEKEDIKILIETYLATNILDPIDLKESIHDLENDKNENVKIIQLLKSYFVLNLFISLKIKLREIPIEPSSYLRIKDFENELFPSYDLHLNKDEIKIIEDICKAKINSFGKIKSLDDFRNEKLTGFLGEIVGSDSMWEFNLNKMTQLKKEEEECIADK